MVHRVVEEVVADSDIQFVNFRHFELGHNAVISAEQVNLHVPILNISGRVTSYITHISSAALHLTAAGALVTGDRRNISNSIIIDVDGTAHTRPG